MALTTTFLSSIRTFVHDQDGAKLRNFLLVEPPVPENYFSMGQELRTGFPAGSKLLEQLIEKCLPEADDVPEGKGSPWPGFVAFMKDYLEFWRDVDFDDLLATHQQLSGLLM